MGCGGNEGKGGVWREEWGVWGVEGRRVRVGCGGKEGKGGVWREGG